MERKTLKYFLDNKNFVKTPTKKSKKKNNLLHVVDDQIVMNCNDDDNEEDGIVTSYTYMKNKGRGKKWTEDENELFLKALECCGTDFSMINLLFPHRTRRNIRDKFKKEIKADPNVIEDSLSNVNKVDLEEFKKLKEIAKKMFEK